MISILREKKYLYVKFVQKLFDKGRNKRRGNYKIRLFDVRK